MTAWIEDLALEGWRFWLEGDRLKFRAPTAAAADGTLARLREARDDIRRLLAASPAALSVAPLSYGQRALWILWRLAPDSLAYNQSLAMEVSPRIPAAAWRAACVALTARHPMLRTCFPWRDGEPFQRVCTDAPLDWREVDLRGQADAEVHAALAAAHNRPFDLAAAPPVRASWIDAERPILLVTMHHIVCDGWSIEIMRRDLQALAGAEVEGKAWSEPPPMRTYQDFVWWQRNLLDGPDGARLLNFWRSQLTPLPAPLDLPLDRSRPTVQTYRGRALRFDLAPALTSRLRALADAEDVTMYVLTLAVFLAVLARWARRDDVVIGTPTAGRSLAELAGVVGYFVDPLAIRASIDGAESFRSFLGRVKRIALDAMAHRDYPFALLVERLQVPRDPSRAPLFDVTFNFLNLRAAERGRSASDAVVGSVDLDQADGKFDLTWTVLDGEEQISASLGYNPDLFEPATIAHVAGWIAHALETASANPDARVDELPLASGVLEPVLSGRRDLTALCPVPTRFAGQAARQPDAPAVVAADRTLSYRELLRDVRGLAEALHEHGVAPGDVVAVVCRRTSAFVVGLLAVMESGAAFLPVDPDTPPAVLRGVFDRARVALAIVDPALEPAYAALDLGVRLVPASIRSPAGTSAAPAIDLDHDAYVIFTSGSTGQPKGVAVTHRSLANYVASIVEDLRIEPGRQFAFVSTVAADLGHTVIFPALTSGGTLHVLPEEAATSPSAFSAYFAAHAIDYLKIVPSHLVALLGEEASGPLPLPARGLFLGGESTPVALVKSLVASGASCRIFNHYGPTETTVGVLTYAVDSERLPETSTLPLDRPIANTDIYVVDASGRSVPRGLSGEVFIAGAALARGYIGDAEQTRERFVTLSNGTRAYSTGDVARVLADGTLLLLGRDDRQINLHGHRIELGHVEAAAAAHPAVRQAVALADADGPAATFVALWLVPKHAPAAGLEAELRNWLADRVPRQMLPSRIVSVPAIPLTSNGKIDVRLLRARLASLPGEDSSVRRLVRDVVEMRLSGIWQNVLGGPPVGIDDDFFDRGGHSLLAVRLAARIADELGRDLPLATFFTHRTVRRLAALLRDERAPASVLVPIEVRGPHAAMVCVPGAGGQVLYFHELVRRMGGRRPVWGLQTAYGPDGGSLRTIEEIAEAYLDELKVRNVTAPYHLAGHSFGALVAYEMARRLRAAGQAVGAVLLLDNPAPGGDGDDADRDTAAWLLHIGTRIAKLYGVDLRLSLDELGRPDGSARLVGRLREAGALPDDVAPAAFERFVGVYEANVRAAAAYRPVPDGFDEPLVLFRARDEDPHLERSRGGGDPALGWTRFSTRPVVIRDVPGTHITMLTEPHVAVLAEEVHAALGEGERST